MFRQFLTNFVWLDICVIIIIVRGCWIGLRKGSLVEVFKIIALFLAIFIGLHFYLDVAHVITGFVRIVAPIAPIFSYSVLVGLVIFTVRIVRDGIMVLLKSDDVSRWSKVGGLVLGFFRGILLGGLVFLGCLIADNITLTRSVRSSYLGETLLLINSNIYSGMHRFIVHPIFPKEEKNVNIAILVENNKRKRD